MASYLPKESNAGSAYQEGGGLYALGRLLSDFTFRILHDNLYIYNKHIYQECGLLYQDFMVLYSGITYSSS
jgi:hypothetical protein